MKLINVHKDISEYVIKEPGRHIFFMHNYSGELVIDLQIADAEVFIFGIYMGRGNDVFTIHTTQKHSVGRNISDLLIKAVLFDEAKFHYEGLIQIDKGAQLSNAYQKNQNLLLSKKAFVDSRPFLEIKANDVRCTHGSTTGRLDPQQILYLQSRGLLSHDVQTLLVEGFIRDVFNRMNEVGVSQKDLDKLLQEVLKEK